MAYVVAFRKDNKQTQGKPFKSLSDQKVCMKPDAKPDAPKNSLLLTSKYIDLCKHINAMLVQKSDKMKNKKVKSSQLGSTTDQ